MDGEQFYSPAYKGSKQYTQQEIKTANATGFGAAADDYMERGIDLNEQPIRNKPATFFFRMKGDAMTEAGIFDNDVLIVDRSLKLVNGKIIVAVLNGELMVRRYHKNFSSSFPVPENSRYKTINLEEFSDFTVVGSGDICDKKSRKSRQRLQTLTAVQDNILKYCDNGYTTIT